MNYRSLGNSGLKVSQFSLGGWTTFGGTLKDKTTVQNILSQAFEAGINFFDIADIYARGECETIMGQTLKGFPRHRIVISSKVFWPMSEDVNDKGLSRKHIMESVEKSLKRIGTDYLDLYFCHRFDPETPLEETIRAMDDLVHQGKILYWGTSEWTGSQIDECNEFCHRWGYYRPQVEQPQYNLIVRDRFENEVAPAAEKWGMGLVTWSPLASGMLTGKYDRGLDQGRLVHMDWLRELFYNETNVQRVKQLAEIADELGCSRSQLALAWTASHRNVSSVILGATSQSQLKENLGALEIPLTDGIKSRIQRLFP